VTTEQTLHSHTFPNGLTLVVEPMPHVQSAAFSFLIPSGSIYDPADQNGSAAVLNDWITRGAGDKNSQQLASALDNLGVQHSENVSNAHLGFSGATLADHLSETLKIFGEIILKPHLTEQQFSPALKGVAQSLMAMEDEPKQKLIVELRRRCYQHPWGIPNYGTLAHLDNLSVESVTQQYTRCFHPNDSILGIAGNVDIDQLTEVVESIFGDWERSKVIDIKNGEKGPSHDHINHDSTQMQIGIAYDSVPYSDPDYYTAWAAVSILSGGMSSRLFTEVREKRGLCYAVSASLNSLKDQACVLCYAGTTVERAQETLDVTLKELQRLSVESGGVTQNELDRCKARAKSALIMQQESSMARASSLARDWYHLSRLTTLDEVHEKIDSLTIDDVAQFAQAHPAEKFTILTIGPEPLNLPD